MEIFFKDLLSIVHLLEVRVGVVCVGQTGDLAWAATHIKDLEKAGCSCSCCPRSIKWSVSQDCS